MPFDRQDEGLNRRRFVLERILLNKSRTWWVPICTWITVCGKIIEPSPRLPFWSAGIFMTLQSSTLHDFIEQPPSRIQFVSASCFIIEFFYRFFSSRHLQLMVWTRTWTWAWISGNLLRAMIIGSFRWSYRGCNTARIALFLWYVFTVLFPWISNHFLRLSFG